MTMNARLQDFLDGEQASYETRSHAPGFTAQEVAALSHVPGRDLAKVVVVRGEGAHYLMAVLPASCRLDLAALAATAGLSRLRLAREEEVQRLFPDCEVGAMPPFGQLYGLPVYVDACFPRQETLFFQAGNHREVVGMPYPEFERLAAPLVGEFCIHERRAGEQETRGLPPGSSGWRVRSMKKSREKRGEHAKGTTGPGAARPAAASSVSHEEIARRAFEICEARGGEPGRELEDWLQAESELRDKPKP